MIHGGRLHGGVYGQSERDYEGGEGVAKESSKAFTNNPLDRSGWQCYFRGSTASKARLETVEWSMRMLGAHPERYGNQDVDHEQDESLPTAMKGSYQLSTRQKRGSEVSITHIQLVLPSAKAMKGHEIPL